MTGGQRRGRKQDLVYTALRDRILSGDLCAGVRLRIDEITRQLEVSHIPVREALKQLQAEGYVTVEPYVGTTVAEVPMERIEEVFELKEALELIAGKAACRAMGDDLLADLASSVRQMDGLLDDPEAWSAANVRLHRLICLGAGKPFVGEMLGKVLDQWDRLRRRYLEEVSAQRIAVAQAEHREILAALQARDQAEVARRITAHNRNALRAYAGHLRLID